MSPAFNPGYAAFVGLGLVMGYVAKSVEEKRLNILQSTTDRRWVTAGALLGAMIGAKLGLLLYLPFPEWRASIRELLLSEWGGRTILGALFGGHEAVGAGEGDNEDRCRHRADGDEEDAHEYQLGRGYRCPDLSHC